MADATFADQDASARHTEKHGLGAFPTVLLLLALALGGAYLALGFELFAIPELPSVPAWTLSAALKASSIVVLALAALIAARGADRWLAAALVLSAVGDVALAWEPGQLLAGMGAFGAAHLAYVALFARRLGVQGTSPIGVLASAALILAGGGALAWLFPAMGSMAWPSAGYMAVLFAMAALALLTRDFGLVALGALSFVASDTMIAVGLYKPDVPIPPGAVWITYVAAQALILVGVLTTAQRRGR